MSDAAGRLITSMRSMIRVVVRGLPLPEGGNFFVDDLRIVIVRRAKASDWPDTPIEQGDLDGVVWIRPEDAFRAAATLQEHGKVIAVRVELAG